MDGRHFAAGPWFTVLEPGKTKVLDTITISDGHHTQQARVEVKIEWPKTTGGSE